MDFLLPYDTVLDMWRRCIQTAYEAEFLYARYAHTQAHTFRRRKRYPVDLRRLSPRSIGRGLGVLGRLFWHLGVRGDYRRPFWRMAVRMLAAGRVEQFVHSALVSHHLIQFTRECLAGMPESSFYAPARVVTAVNADA